MIRDPLRKKDLLLLSDHPDIGSRLTFQEKGVVDTKEKFRAKKIRRLKPAGVVCHRVDPAGAQGEQTPKPSDPIEARQERCPRRNFGSLAPPVYSQFRQSLNPSWTLPTVLALLMRTSISTAASTRIAGCSPGPHRRPRLELQPAGLPR